MKRRRGFILAYATVVMAFVMILITGMITLVNSSALIGIRAGAELDERMKLDQIGEYFAAGRDDLAQARAVEWGYTISFSDLPASATSDNAGNHLASAALISSKNHPVSSAAGVSKTLSASVASDNAGNHLVSAALISSKNHPVSSATGVSKTLSASVASDNAAKLPASATSDSSENSSVNAPAGVRSASVSKEGKTVLYIERKPSESGGYTVICWIYGEKGENDAV